MAQVHSIANLIGLKDPNITIIGEVEEVKVNGQKRKVVPAKLTYIPKQCAHCQVENKSTKDIIKNGTNISTILVSYQMFIPVYLKLAKQRFLCKHCQRTFIASSDIVDRHCYIARSVKQSITAQLTKQQSMTLIAQMYIVSVSTVIRLLRLAGKELAPKVLNPHRLPEHLGIDEFKSVKKVKGKMSCILVDTHQHQLIDILEDRTQAHLRDYFMRYPYEERQKVKTITMDMYRPYYEFLKSIFPNADIIIDRFHIVQHLNRALNLYRVKVMNQLKYKSPTDYRKLKQQWKLILKNEDRLDFEHYQSHRLYEGLVTKKMRVEYLLSLDCRFRLVYDTINHLKYAIDTHDIDLFNRTLEESKKQTFPRRVRTAINSLYTYYDGIINSLIYNLSNGVVEGLNNKIKNIKRSGYGYRNFDHLRYRIFLAQNRFIQDRPTTVVTYAEVEAQRKAELEVAKAPQTMECIV